MCANTVEREAHQGDPVLGELIVIMELSLCASTALPPVLRQFYLIRGSAAHMAPLLVWVAIDILLWGFITKYLNAVRKGNRFVLWPSRTESRPRSRE